MLKNLLWGIPLIALGWGSAHFFLGRKTESSVRTPATSTDAIYLHEHRAYEAPICQDFYKYVCQQHELSKGDGRDPTGIVRPDVEGERIASNYLKDIVQQHPDWDSDEVDEELVKSIYTPERTGRVEAAYHWAQNRIEHFISSQPDRVFSAREKREIIARLQRTSLQLPPPASNYSDEPDLFTKNDVYYERTPEGILRMRVGGAYLFTAKSWFNIVFTISHELGHSIDPCEIRQARLSYPAYDHLTACFLRTGLVKTSKVRSECEENDQLSEAFADWIATQVSAEALKTFSQEFHGPQLINATVNSVRDLCEQDDAAELDEENHPSPKVRIEKIYGNQPEIRSVLGCSVPEKPITPAAALVASANDYCNFESVIPAYVKPAPSTSPQPLSSSSPNPGIESRKNSL